MGSFFSGQLNTFQYILSQLLRFFYLLQNSILILFPLVLNQLVLLTNHFLHIKQLLLENLWGLISSLSFQIIQKNLILHLIFFVELLGTLQAVDCLLVFMVHFIEIFLICTRIIVFHALQIFDHGINKILIKSYSLFFILTFSLLYFLKRKQQKTVKHVFCELILVICHGDKLSSILLTTMFTFLLCQVLRWFLIKLLLNDLKLDLS